MIFLILSWICQLIKELKRISLLSIYLDVNLTLTGEMNILGINENSLVNSDLVSNDTIWDISGTLLCFTVSIKCYVLLMVYSYSLEGDIFDKCFASWYVAVFKFDTIGLTGSWSTLPFLGIMNSKCAIELSWWRPKWIWNFTFTFK